MWCGQSNVGAGGCPVAITAATAAFRMLLRELGGCGAWCVLASFCSLLGLIDVFLCRSELEWHRLTNVCLNFWDWLLP